MKIKEDARAAFKKFMDGDGGKNQEKDMEFLRKTVEIAFKTGFMEGVDAALTYSRERLDTF